MKETLNSSFRAAKANKAQRNSSSSNQYACANIVDKVTLLSYAEVNTYYSPAEERKPTGTDFAYANYLYQLVSYWWTRSAHSKNNSAIAYVTNGSAINANISWSYIGIRPVITIKIS